MIDFDAIRAAAAHVRHRLGDRFDAAVVVGSGLDPIVERLDSPRSLPYESIPHFPRPTVAGHAGLLVAGRLGGRPVLVFRGRFHHYEGHALDVVTLPVRVMQALGIRRVILTAATGGIRSDLGPGSIVALTDHLNLLGASPLRGPNDSRLGERFPDLSAVYAPRLIEVVERVAAERRIPLARGVYACVPGPNYETPAEVRMLRALGADVVGMSTVPEAIVARHAGLEVLGLAIVANHAAGLSDQPLSHADVLAAVAAVAARTADLLEAAMPLIAPATTATC